jgi:AcrR family transcriptional regulator
MMNLEHETRARILNTAVELLEELPEREITASEILRRTGIARGSLYHFWKTIGDLIEEAYVVRYSRYVSNSSAVISELIEKSKSKEEFIAGLNAITVLTQAPERKSNRFTRARILALAEKNESFRKRLGEVQQSLTDQFTEQVKLSQDRGWLNKDFDPRAVAVLIQAYTLGKIVDDVVDSPMDPEAWNSLIRLIVIRAFAQPD